MSQIVLSQTRKRKRMPLGMGGETPAQKKAKSMAKKINRIAAVIREEKKFLYNQTGGTGVSGSSPFIQCQNLIGQGDDYYQRSGSSILLDRLEFNYSLIYGDATNFMRVLLVWDKQPNSTSVSSTQLGQVLWDTTTAVSGIVSPYNHYFKDRFVILFDKVHNLSQQGPAVDSYKGVIKVSKRSDYSSSGIVTPSTGALYVFVLSDSAVTPNPILNWYSRLVFNP